jgi:hypothetical protein
MAMASDDYSSDASGFGGSMMSDVLLIAITFPISIPYLVSIKVREHNASLHVKRVLRRDAWSLFEDKNSISYDRYKKMWNHGFRKYYGRQPEFLSIVSSIKIGIEINKDIMGML